MHLREAYENAEKGWELDSFKTTGFPPLEEFLVPGLHLYAAGELAANLLGIESESTCASS